MAIFVKVLRSKVMVWNKSKKANMQMSTASPQPVFAALHTVKASESIERSNCELKAAFTTYEYSSLVY